MTNSIALGIILMIIGLSIFYSIKDLREDESLIGSLEKVFYYISIFLAFLIMLVNLNYIYINIVKFAAITLNITTSIELNIFKIIALLCIFFLIQWSINLIFRLIIKVISYIYEKIKMPKIIDYFFTVILGFTKGFVIILILFLGISSYNNTFIYKKQINVFNNNLVYNFINDYVAKNKSVILYNDIKDYVPEDSVQVFYNGVPLEYGIESSEQIGKKAKALTQYLSTDREKAKAIYAWIGSNIEYDYKKAEDILDGKTNYDSGAKAAWKDKSGICFDYACLYIAMSREIGLPVRLITGQASNGNTYGPHAWNQVYISDENSWINVDPTFYSNGDYFDTELFWIDHKEENIAGEWK